MFPSFILGVLGGFTAVRLLTRCRAHGGGWRRGGRALSFLSRELDLDPRQQAEVEALLGSVRGALRGLRAGRWQGLGAAVEAFGPESFDRARVEQAAAEKAAALSGVKQEAIDALARLHEILTPAQRERLRALAGRLLSRV
jgi:Spy/CpxP family protein refolding chaperone